MFGPPGGAELREAAQGLDESCFDVFVSPVVFTDEADREGEEYKRTKRCRGRRRSQTTLARDKNGIGPSDQSHNDQPTGS